MSSNLTPYLISEFKTGINTYLQPWMRPADAFEPMVNAYVNRGTVNKRAGYSQYGATVADGNPIMGIMQYLDQSTGATSLVVATTVNLYLYNAGTGVYGPIALPSSFTGNISNFFNWTNWQAFTGSTSYLWMVNNKDKVTRFDGAAATQPDIVINGAGTKITKALDVKVYKQRLLLIRPTLSVGGTQNQSIYWSKQQNPDLWLVDTAGNGGNLDAPTGDTIISAEFIRDVLVVFFTSSTWIFRYTGNDTAPFRWDKVNDSKNTNAPYGSIDYDQRCTAIGSTGLIACDGVNVQRYDIPIIDYYETIFSERYYAQAFGERYDNLNQGWVLYVSQNNTFPKVGAVAPGSDQALIYNFVENSFATYTFPIPLTCLGLFFSQGDVTWSSLGQSWETTEMAWNSYTTQYGAPILLAGDTTGHVWYMDNQLEVTDKKVVNSVAVPVSIVPDIVTTRWNPIVSLGQKVQFPYIDIYYLVAETTSASPVSVTLNFYVDNSEDPAVSKTLTLDGPTKDDEEVIGVGTGASSYSGLVTGVNNIVPGTFSVTTTTSGGVEKFTDNGLGVLIGSLGDTGTINYVTSAWSITLTGRTIAVGIPINASFEYYPGTSQYAFKRIYVNLIGEFFQMEIDPNVDSLMQFVGFIIWAKPSGRLTP